MTESEKRKKSTLPGRILLIAGIILLLLLLIGGGLFLTALRRLHGDEQIPIVSREEEYVMETMGETIQYVDEWENYGGETEAEEMSPTPDETGTAADTVTEAVTEAETAAPVQVPIFQQNKNNKDVINVLLLGRDARNAAVEYGRTDSMIILSYN